MTPSGQSFIKQWRISSSPGQQLGELASLLGAIYTAANLTAYHCKHRIVCGDNLGSLFTAVESTRVSMEGKAYWMRRLCKSLLDLADQSSDVGILHIPGKLLPADDYTRSVYQFPDWTFLGMVPVITP